jgi:ProP effector
MSNASLKEQLQAVASKISEFEEKPVIFPVSKTTQHVVKSKKQKPKWLEYVQYGVELLKAYFPASFKASHEVMPLKKGIKQDLVKRLSTMNDIVTEDKACMIKSLTYYVNTAAYHKRVVKGAARIDLDGETSGVVTAEEAQYSMDKYQAKAQVKKEMSAPVHLQS